MTMNYQKLFRSLLMSTTLVCAMICVCLTVAAQDQAQDKTDKKTAAATDQVSEKSAKGRDPFKKYQPVIKAPKGAPAKLEPPSIQVRIERYRAQKAAAASAHIAAPKPTTALLLNEVQVTGIFHTPRGWSAMVEASPLTPRLSYVVYPGENFFDGQLVAIEEGRLIFRRDIVWTDGRRDKSVEIKPLRAPSPVEAMTAVKTAPAEVPATEVAKPAPAKQ
jgi:Tfp pilus assembly protein PilP